MKLFGGLLGQQKPKTTATKPTAERIVSMTEARNRGGQPPLDLSADMPVAPERPRRSVAASRREVPPAGVNIWDLEDTSIDGPAPAASAAAQPDPLASPPPSGRARRNRTRLIGFESPDTGADDPFAQPQQAQEVAAVMFPVGWLVLIDGPGRGNSFPLFAGMAQIGRGEENAVRLDFGDNSVSRKNHAAIVYDPQDRKFVLGHGGKSNIVRLNSKPLISNEDLRDGDIVKIGETTLILKALCGAAFDWSQTRGTDAEEYTDVAIA